ncbi:hypothetical protein F0L68_11540 [Solihabitans fulvus]|uniref:Uncharacterized protein n=1 Tax=Solihabitans fulvus TaxID=1892852 RepID=A0A5B2XHH8_9PSEU|nr:hypothetical protein [Solihabitans fulvus]KAA2262853.1 hypothetical protein F0L68_11540 [Solihabitans fulvus]
MLRDVVGAFLDTVTEREFDAPLLALLAARGFTDVHFLHGAFEFGKDVIAKGPKPLHGDVGSGDPASWTLHQFALQSKAGDMGAPGWREVRPQLDEARLDGLGHPAFDVNLPRAGVLVVTGRLKGAASTQAQSYREQELRWGRPDFEIWDRERLLEWLIEAPEVGLAGISDGPMLSLAGAIDDGTVTLSALERHSRSWLPPVQDTLTAATTPRQEVTARQRRAAVEAAVLVNGLRRYGRLDLASMTALMLLRASWCHALNAAASTDPIPRPEQAAAAIRLFVGCASELLDQVEPVAADPRALLARTVGSPLGHVLYPVACARLVEILGLLGLLTGNTSGPCGRNDLLPPPDRVYDTVATLLRYQPGCSHPIADSFAVSLIAPTLLVAGRDASVARTFLERTAVWIADRYDGTRSGIGLAATGADPRAEIDQLLGGPYEHGPQRRPGSYLATVVTDLATLVPGDDSFYQDVINEFLAVDIFAQLRIADEHRAQWRPDGAGVRFITQVPYRDSAGSMEPVSAHHDNVSQPVSPWDAVALASVVRDRHVVPALRAALTESLAGPSDVSESA